MSKVGSAVGGFFDGMFGGDPQGGIDPAVERQQAEMERQQKAQLDQQKKQVEQQRISMLKGRFSTNGGNDAAANSSNNDAAAASLFSRITGRE